MGPNWLYVDVGALCVAVGPYETYRCLGKADPREKGLFIGSPPRFPDIGAPSDKELRLAALPDEGGGGVTYCRDAVSCPYFLCKLTSEEEE